MSDAFISYRRKPSSALAQLIQRELKYKHGLNAYVDTTRSDSTRVQFPDRLMEAIADAPTFICLLGDSTLDSTWVGKEIQRAYELKKHCIPVFQETYVPADDSDPAINYLLSFDGVHVFDVKNEYIDEAISKIAALVVRKQPRRKWGLWGAALLVVLIGIVAVGGLLLSGGDDDNPEPTQPTELAQQSSATDTEESVASITVTPSQTPTLTETPDQQASDEVLHQQNSTQTAAAWTATPSPTRTLSPSPTPTLTETPDQQASDEVLHQQNSTQTAAAWTATPSPTRTSSPSPTPTLTETPDYQATGRVLRQQQLTETAAARPVEPSPTRTPSPTSAFFILQDFDAPNTWNIRDYPEWERSEDPDLSVETALKDGKLLLGIDALVSNAFYWHLFPIPDFHEEKFEASAQITPQTDTSGNACIGYYVGDIGTRYYMLFACNYGDERTVQIWQYRDDNLLRIRSQPSLISWTSGRSFGLSLTADSGHYTLRFNGLTLIEADLDTPARSELGFAIFLVADRESLEAEYDNLQILRLQD